jgi:hypothetical protein
VGAVDMIEEEIAADGGIGETADVIASLGNLTSMPCPDVYARDEKSCRVAADGVAAYDAWLKANGFGSSSAA